MDYDVYGNLNIKQSDDWSLNFLNSKIADSFLISFVKAL